MKAVKIVGHPIFFLCSYLLFITEGQSFGGFYMIYLLVALPHFALYAVLAVLGIAGVIIGYNFLTYERKISKFVVSLIGFLLMVLSLIDFFMTGDQSRTFQLKLPTITFVVLSICCFGFITNLFLEFKHVSNRKTN